jgi:predicted DNA-binding protein with PD1-like motif
MNGHLTVHAHGAVADQNYWMSGGHVKRIVVGPTCEMYFTRIAGVLKRTPDLGTRLNLLK